VPQEFAAIAEDLRIVADLLNDYLRDSHPDKDGSLAHADWSQEAQLGDDNVPDPVSHIARLILISMVAAMDHILGIAACVSSERVVFATMSLMRPAVVAAGAANYLLDPTIDTRERLRRGWNFELAAMSEQLSAIDQNTTPNGWTRLSADQDRYLAWAQAHGYQLVSKKARYKGTVWSLSDGDRTGGAPSEIQLAESVLTALGPRFGRTVYRFTSAFVHAQPHAATLLTEAPNAYDPQTPYATPLGESSAAIATWVSVITMAAHAVATNAAAYFDWDLDEWITVVDPIMDRWASLANAR